MMGKIDNTKRYEAEMRPLELPFESGGKYDWFKVHSTCEHPDSSYGIPVWVDDKGTCYGSLLYPSALYDIRNVREVQG